MEPKLTPKSKVGKNELCPCKSGLKSKFCHSDPRKKAICEIAVRETMLRLIMQEKHKQGMITDEQLEMILNPKGENDEREESKIIY